MFVEAGRRGFIRWRGGRGGSVCRRPRVEGE